MGQSMGRKQGEPDKDTESVEISTDFIDCEIHVEESCFAIVDHGVPIESSTETVDQGIYVENFTEIEQTREQNEFGKEEKIREE
jgi:hypothetical protein